MAFEFDFVFSGQGYTPQVLAIYLNFSSAAIERAFSVSCILEFT
jgi:hypothetical protein